VLSICQTFNAMQSNIPMH